MLLQSYPKLKNTLWERKLRKASEQLDRAVDRNVFIAFKSRANFIEENPDIPMDHLVAFHNGIDDKPCVKKERISDCKYNLCVSGTVCERKGQYLIIDALIKSPKEVRDKIHVTIIGTGADLDLLKAKVVENNLESNIAFLGNVANNKVHDILCMCDIYILISNSEGLPISIIEGLRAGLGVISTPVAGIPEMVRDDNGVLINPNSDELANLFANIESYDWETFGKNSRKLFEEEYDFSRMISSYCDMMDELLN
jgi:glycosyltransferase involved in cell wall biosynthesis